MTRSKEITIGELRDGDTVLFDHPEGVAPLTLQKVWRYEDGSVTLEFKSDEPGMWNFSGNDLELTVTVRT